MVGLAAGAIVSAVGSHFHYDHRLEGMTCQELGEAAADWDEAQDTTFGVAYYDYSFEVRRATWAKRIEKLMGEKGCDQ